MGMAGDNARDDPAAAGARGPARAAVAAGGRGADPLRGRAHPPAAGPGHGAHLLRDDGVGDSAGLADLQHDDHLREAERLLRLAESEPAVRLPRDEAAGGAQLVDLRALAVPLAHAVQDLEARQEEQRAPAPRGQEEGRVVGRTRPVPRWCTYEILQGSLHGVYTSRHGSV